MNFMDNQSEMTESEVKDLRHLIGRRLKSVHKFISEKFKQETEHYIKIYRNEFKDILPERLLKMDDIDVNVVYPIIKTLIPSLYFQDPKVLVKSDQEKIIRPVIDPMTNEVVINPSTGTPMLQEYDGVKSALIFQSTLNHSLRETGFKKEIKSAILDAHIGFFGAVKNGFGNPQGVKSMGDGAPPTPRENVFDDMCYGIRLKPWDVCPDMNDFYHQEWVGIRYLVNPKQLKSDKRLSNTDKIEGKAEMDKDQRKEIWSAMDSQDLKLSEYFEYYHLPCAEYPEGLFAIVCEEVPDEFLYISKWPYAALELPVKFLYFNEDPQGGLPIPDCRYYIEQQKAKSNLRRVAYEYIQRTLPVMGVDVSKVNSATVKNEIASGQIPRVVGVNGNPNAVLGAASFANLNTDFTRFDLTIDDDVSRVVGLTNGAAGGAGANVEFASVAKQSAQTQAIRTNERADILREFMKSVIKLWSKLLQEFGSDENFTPIEGQKFPIKWSVDEIQGPFTFDIQPFSMNYEDPMIRRRQYIDLLNLLSSPELRMSLAQQGAEIDYLKIVNRVLESYDERDVESFVIDEAAKPENQVARAMQEVLLAGQGQPPQIAPTDNDKLHIILHDTVGRLAGVDMSEHILMHNQAMQEKMAASSPGGGNVGGQAVNGVASDQQMMKQPIQPSSGNAAVAQARQATSER